MQALVFFRADRSQKSSDGIERWRGSFQRLPGSQCQKQGKGLGNAGGDRQSSGRFAERCECASLMRQHGRKRDQALHRMEG
ncbi:MAG: hypothetical protein HC809_00405 [Gammaproteobacteria bacterium]|nr:hypothetical protein [Gammaproteobacteria bacterium]